MKLIFLAAGLFLGAEFFRWIHARLRPVPVLLYHFIDGEGEKSGLSVSSANFEKHLKYLMKHNFRVISAEEFLQASQIGKRLPANSVIITFDDGDEAFYTKVYPLLLKYQIPAAVFVITGWIDRPGYLSWRQLRVMSPEVVTIGSHTVSHRYLPDIPLDEVRKEFVESRQVLERELKRPVSFLSYPVGGFSVDIAGLAQEAGYMAAFTTNRGRNFWQRDLFALKRVKMTDPSTQPHVLWAKFSGYYPIASEFRPKSPDGSQNKNSFPGTDEVIKY